MIPNILEMAHMHSLIRNLLLTIALASPLTVYAITSNAPAATATLRVVCEDDGAGADVTVNGVHKGQCPLTVQVPHGTVKLQVKKKVDALHERVFKKNISIVSGAEKKVTVKLPAARPTAKKQKKPTKTAKQKTGKSITAAKREADKRAQAAKLRLAEARKQAKKTPATPAGSPMQPRQPFRDCENCPEMVVVPPGNFYMGSPSFEARRQKVEDTVHHVAISNAFALGKNEVTRGQFAAFVKDANYTIGDKCWTFEDGKYAERSARSWQNPGYVQDDNHPATCVSWLDAKAYGEWLSHKTGKQYRLPSESEWEYAARGNTVVVRYQEINPDNTCDNANVTDSVAKAKISGITWEAHNCSDGYAYTAPAGSFKPNAFGLNDMIGNVWEWVEDGNHNDYKGAPTDGSAWQGDGTWRILRGGSWSDDPQGARPAARGKAKHDLRNSTIGFRVARIMQ